MGMTGHTETIHMLGGAAPVADYLSVPKVRVDRWTARDRIPPEYWPSLEMMARARGVAGVTVGALLLTHRPRKSAALAAAGAA